MSMHVWEWLALTRMPILIAKDIIVPHARQSLLPPLDHLSLPQNECQGVTTLCISENCGLLTVYPALQRQRHLVRLALLSDVGRDMIRRQGAGCGARLDILTL